MRILLVDDDEDILDSTGALLESAGHRVEAVRRASDVLGALRRFGPEVVLQDVNMPGLVVDALVADIRRHAPGVPIVLFTAAADAEDTVRRLAADALLKKPFQFAQLAGILESLRRVT